MANKAKKKPVKAKRQRTRRRTTRSAAKYIAPKSMQFGQFAEGWIPYMHKMTFEPIPATSSLGVGSRLNTFVPFLQEQRQPQAAPVTLRDVQTQAGTVDRKTGFPNPLEYELAGLGDPMELDIAREAVGAFVARRPDLLPGGRYIPSKVTKKRARDLFNLLGIDSKGLTDPQFADFLMDTGIWQS